LPGITRRLLTLARDSRLALAATVLSGFLTGLLTIGQAAGLSRILDGVFLGGQLLADVAGLLRLLLLIVSLRALLAWGSEVSANAVAVRVKSELRKRLFEKILSLGPAYTRSERTGELVNAADEGVEALDAYFSQYLPQLVIAALVPLSILMVVFPRDVLSGIVLLLTAPLIPVFMYLIGKTAELLTKRQWDTLSRLSAHFLDSLQGLTTLKELGRSKEHANSIAEVSNRFRDVTLNVLRLTFLSALVLELVATLSTAVVAVEVGLRLLYGQIAFQQAIFLLLLAPEFYIPLRMLGLRFHAGMSGTTAARRIFEILDLPVSSEQESGIRNQTSRPLSLSPASVIAFEDLSYAYPGETVPALRDITLEIHAGEHIALVGVSGAGKSTLAALLLRFIHPGSGQITINHEPLSIFSIESWRSLIAWVPQDPYLFHDTVSANLRLAQPDATDGQLVGAARAAHLDEFIQSLPQGYGTVVGEEGARLSSGQAQRLALARAFLKNAPILILDEPTSSLDPEQEMLVESAVHDLMRGRTVITIAHRFNTVFRADRIFVLDQGRLAEEGTHGELMAQGEIYSRLVGAAGEMEDLTSKSEGREENYEYVSSDSCGSCADLQTITQPPSSIVRLLGFLHGAWGWVALSVLLGVLTVGSNIGLMGTSAFLISAAALHPQLGTLMVAIAGVRFFGIARGVFRYAERLASHNVTFRLLARLRSWFYRALEPLAPARLMQYRSGDLLSRIIADVDTLENFYVRVVSPPLVATVIAAGMTIFFGRYDLHLAWIYLAFTLVLGIGVPLLSWAVSRRAGTELVSRRATLKARLVDGILGMPDLLVFGRGIDYSESLISDGKAYGKTQRQLASLTGFTSALTTLLVNLGMLAVLVITVPLVATGQVSGMMLAVLTLSALAGFEAVIPLPLASLTLSSSLQSARRLFEMADAQPMVRESFSIRRDPLSESPTDHNLQILNLAFSYPGRSQPALQDITFQLAPGKRVAIVGPSGAGKSTLANLLLRFWDYSQGCILLDGREIHEFAQEDVRRMVSFISQRPYFFNDTIRQNMLLARPTATDSEVQNAAQRAQIHEFIVGLPKGYETIIGERGFRLSGGERQRLAIARTLLKNAPIFLLDEPTANLDPLNERLILDVLFRLTRGQSLLLITHRLVGLENMDEILVLDHGRIIERGTHPTLLAVGGLYRRLWDLQNRILSDRTVA
jgi:ATP-binding cassette subfamily C protein CydCD